MKKGIILGMLAGILLVAMLSNVSAYWEYRTYYDDCYDFGDCEPNDYGLYVRVGQDGGYGYYDYPRSYDRYPNYNSGYYSGYYSTPRYYSGHYCGWDGCDDDEEREYRRNLRTAIRDVSEEYDNWQYDLIGKTSAEAYGYGEGNKASDWGNKEAYVASDPWRETDYYATPRWDSESGTFNWRY